MSAASMKPLALLQQQHRTLPPRNVAGAVLPESEFIHKSTRVSFLHGSMSVASAKRTRTAGAAFASSAEPKWKQKQAAADEKAEKSRRATALAQEQYRQRQETIRRQQGGSASNDLPSLMSLPFVPYLTEEGKIVDCSKPEAKANVYAVFDEAKVLHYVGVSRAVYPSMKLHFARVPSKCFYAKVECLTKPSRMLLESIRDKWIAENGSRPPGNDNGEQQNIWENPLDCKPLMTDEEKGILSEAAPGPPTAKVLKNVARRLEKGLLEQFKQRKCTETLRFDPKLKDRGLLDVKNLDPKVIKKEPDSAVPTTDLRKAATAS